MKERRAHPRKYSSSLPIHFSHEDVVGSSDGFLKVFGERVDVVLLRLHVLPQFIEQRLEQDHAVTHRVLELANTLQRHRNNGHD